MQASGAAWIDIPVTFGMTCGGTYPGMLTGTCERFKCGNRSQGPRDPNRNVCCQHYSPLPLLCGSILAFCC